MSKKTLCLIAVVALLVSLLTLTNNTALAIPGAPLPPDPTPKGGHVSSSGGGYSPAGFERYTDPLKSGDGSVIGRIDAENFNSYMVWAEKNGTVGNTTYVLTLEGELSSKLSNDCWLDINFLEPGSSGFPPGMENGIVFAVVNITKNPDWWSWKSGSPKYTLKISGSTLNPGDTYYLIRSSGSDYQMQKVNVDASGSQATIKCNPPGDSGIFTIMVPVLPTPTPTPTPTPVPTPTTTPVPENNWMWGFPIFIAMFAVGVIVGAAALFIFTRNR